MGVFLLLMVGFFFCNMASGTLRSNILKQQNVDRWLRQPDKASLEDDYEGREKGIYGFFLLILVSSINNIIEFTSLG